MYFDISSIELIMARGSKWPGWPCGDSGSIWLEQTSLKS
jgi:hypothetical protein